ncbi:MAG: SLC13 family permease [Deltaproteobacteria bacterium]|nr:SLC13 family permease [Deltaproteobacteria bacterium]
MSWEAWLTIGIVAAMTVGLAMNVAAADALLLLTAIVLASLRLISDQFLEPDQVAAAFGNEGLVTVGALFVVAAGLTHSGGTSRVGTPMLGRPDTNEAAQVRLMLPVVGTSAFLNNTTVVAMFLPVVKEWARLRRLDVSKLLLPLSYAAILGGICTLIGTSTNIVVQGLMTEANVPEMGMFTITPVAVPIALVGIVYVIVAARFLLPSRTPAGDKLSDARQYTVELDVEVGSPLDGTSIAAAGLRALPGLYLVEVRRELHVEAAVGPDFVLRGKDRLVFAGVVQSVADLHNIRGLKSVVHAQEEQDLDVPRHDRIFVECVVSQTSPLVGKSIRDARFRTRYEAAVLAVHRNGELLPGKIGDMVVRPGDTLLVEAAPAFVEQQRDRKDFFLVSRVKSISPVRHERAWISLAILALVVIGGGLEPWTHVGTLPFALLGAALVVVMGCASMDQARKSIDWSVLFAIGAALIIAKTLDSTGAADGLASALLSLVGGAGPVGALAAIYLCTLILTEVLTNNAAAALAFPIAHATAQSLHVSTMPFAIAVCLAASCGFATPMGYQTHLMVYGAGGYRFSDFLRMGLGLDLVCMIIAVILIPLLIGF